MEFPSRELVIVNKRTCQQGHNQKEAATKPNHPIPSHSIPLPPSPQNKVVISPHTHLSHKKLHIARATTEEAQECSIITTRSSSPPPSSLVPTQPSRSSHAPVPEKENKKKRVERKKGVSLRFASLPSFSTARTRIDDAMAMAQSTQGAVWGPAWPGVFLLLQTAHSNRPD